MLYLPLQIAVADDNFAGLEIKTHRPEIRHSAGGVADGYWVQVTSYGEMCKASSFKFVTG